MGRRKKESTLEQITLRTRNIKQNKCPVSSINYYGNCPNYTCPYNLVRVTKGEKTGCFFENSSAVLSDIGRVLRLNRSQMKARYQESMLRLEKSVALFNALTELRHETNHVCHCKHCGAPLELGDACLNVFKCKKRQEIVRKVLEFSILSNPGLNGNERDIWLIAEHYSYEEFMEKYNFPISKRIWNYVPPKIHNPEKHAQPELANG
jgi:hypothetical protein